MLPFSTALIASTILLFLAGLHIYWGRGGYWPAKSESGLLATVVGTSPTGRMPGAMACFAVTAFLAFAAAIPLAAQGLFPLPGAHIALYTLAGVFALRGVGGYFDRFLRPETVGLPYDRLNRVVYSPLCLVLAALLVVGTF